MKRILRMNLVILLGAILTLVTMPLVEPPAHAQTSKSTVRLLPLLSRTASTQSSGFNLQNHPANKVIGYLSSGAGSGGTITLDCKLQDSPDNVIWADVPSAAFTQVVAAAASLRVAPAAAVGAYVRVLCTQGAGSTFVYQIWMTTYFSATAYLWPEPFDFPLDFGGRPGHAERALAVLAG